METAKQRLARQIKGAIATKAKELGFDEIGFTSASLDRATKERLAVVEAQHTQGIHASGNPVGMGVQMPWLYDTLERRASATTLLPSAQSVIVVAVSYAAQDSHQGERCSPDHNGDPLRGEEASIADDVADKAVEATIARYARGRDYHRWFVPRLSRLAEFIQSQAALLSNGEPAAQCETVIAVDTKPIAEKPFAQQAGVGWQGKHTNLVSRNLGSWFLLGEVVTSLALPPDAAGHDHCGSCHACKAACPTDALDTPYQLNAAACIAYLTIEHRGMIPRKYRTAIGQRVFGCDDCLAACPWNKFAQRAKEADFHARREWANTTLTELAKMTEQQFELVSRGSPIRRAKHEGFLRNVQIGLANAYATKAEQTPHHDQNRRHQELEDIWRSLLQHVKHANPIIRATTAWAIQHVVQQHGVSDAHRAEGQATLAQGLKAETHDIVRAEYRDEPS